MAFKLADEYPSPRHVIDNKEEIRYVVSFSPEGTQPEQDRIIDLHKSEVRQITRQE
jgi:hypothetical protein